jgi:hypothetical protein
MKPIFVCYIEPKKEEEIQIIRLALEKELINDYHILLVSDENYVGIKFELFNAPDNAKDFEYLKLKLKENDR